MTERHNDAMADALRAKNLEWENAVKKGPYKFVTRVDQENEAIAHETASEVVASTEQTVATHGLRKVIKKLTDRFNRADVPSPHSRMRQIASHELVGNTELAYAEMQSGLLEPYRGNELASIMARNILSGNYEVVTAPDASKS